MNAGNDDPDTGHGYHNLLAVPSGCFIAIQILAFTVCCEF